MLNQDLTRWVDPCLARQHISAARLAAFVVLFLSALGTGPLLFVFGDRPYGIQLTSAFGYTAAVALYTFSRNRNDNQPFLLSCPVVRAQVPTLIRRHLIFLVALFAVQTIAIKLRPSLPTWWITPSSKHPSPFAIVLGLLSLCLGTAEILSNRSLLDRAHSEAKGETGL
jgi:hypothetical protein